MGLSEEVARAVDGAVELVARTDRRAAGDAAYAVD